MGRHGVRLGNPPGGPSSSDGAHRAERLGEPDRREGDTPEPPDILRRWQGEAAALYRHIDRPDFLANVTPGAGKTLWALHVATELMNSQQVERLVVVVHSDYLRHQWEDAAEDRGLSCEVVEGVRCSLQFPVFDGRMLWRDEGEEREAAFSDKLKPAERRHRLKAAQDANSQFCRSLLAAADAKLREYPGEGGLVLARDTKHARELAAVLHELTGETPVLATSATPSARKRIDGFKYGTDSWLVAVRMVSEGVDIPRLRVLAYCANVETPLFFAQAMGRICRGQGEAFCYMPAHPAFVEMANGLCEDRFHQLEASQEAQVREAMERGCGRVVEVLGAEGEQVGVLVPVDPTMVARGSAVEGLAVQAATRRAKLREAERRYAQSAKGKEAKRRAKEERMRDTAYAKRQHESAQRSIKKARRKRHDEKMCVCGNRLPWGQRKHCGEECRRKAENEKRRSPERRARHAKYARERRKRTPPCV